MSRNGFAPGSANIDIRMRYLCEDVVFERGREQQQPTLIADCVALAWMRSSQTSAPGSQPRGLLPAPYFLLVVSIAFDAGDDEAYRCRALLIRRRRPPRLARLSGRRPNRLCRRRPGSFRPP